MKGPYALLHTFFALFALLVATAAQAQGPAFGLKAGLNYANLYSENLDDKDARFGFHVGVFSRSDPEQPIGIQAELLYSTRGAEFVYDGLLIDQKTTFKTDYIDLPVMVGIRLAEILEVQAGVYAGLLLHSEVETDGDLGSGDEELDTDNFRALDYGVLVGLAINAGPMQVGARYNIGLAQIADSDAAEAVLGDSKHSFAQVFLAIGVGNGR